METTLIMPVVFAVILLVIYLCIYSYDRSVFEYAAYSACSYFVRNINSGLSKEELQDGSIEVSEEIIRRKAIGNWENAIDITEKDDEVFVEITGNMGNSQKMLNSVLLGKVFGIKICCYRSGVSEAEWVRLR